MVSLYIFTWLIGTIIQIALIIKIKKTGDFKYWNRFIGIALAWLISAALAYFVFSKNALGLSGAIVCLVVCGISLVCNIILFVIGLLIKKSLNDNVIKFDKSLLLSSVLVVILNILILFVAPLIVAKIDSKTGEKRVVNYLDNKYGKSNYKVENIYKEYSNVGMTDRYLSGYYYEMKSDYMDKTFIIYIDHNFNYIDEDYFLPVYYSVKNELDYTLEYKDRFGDLNVDFSGFDEYINEIIEKQITSDKEFKISVLYEDYVNSWNNISGVDYNDNYYIIPDDNGKIPAIVEIVRGLIKYNKNKN